MELTITVTQEDIDLGERCESMICPIARAAARAFGHPVAVGTVGIYDPYMETRMICELPEWVSRWIGDFDDMTDRALMEPIEFTVTVPDPDRTADSETVAEAFERRRTLSPEEWAEHAPYPGFPERYPSGADSLMSGGGPS